MADMVSAMRCEVWREESSALAMSLSTLPQAVLAVVMRVVVSPAASWMRSAVSSMCRCWRRISVKSSQTTSVSRTFC